MTSTPVEIDRSLGFTLPERHARGRAVRLGPLVDGIASAHAYPPAIERLLAESLALTALLGALLKDNQGQMTLQAQTKGGVVSLLVCDYERGTLRGYAQFDEDKLEGLPAEPTLPELFGEGYLAITFDQAVTGERYQGIVPLEGDSIAAAAENYFAQSEQIPSLLRIAVRDDGVGLVVGGLLLQHLPEGEEGRDRLHTRLDHPEWEHVATLGRTISVDELVDRDLDLETILWRLFNEEEVRVLNSVELRRGCRCDEGHIRSVLLRFPQEERQEMADEAGLITVDCAFCSSHYEFRLGELADS